MQSVLEQIDALDVPQIMIYNKIDQINMLPSVDLDAHGRIQNVWMSAITGDGQDLLVQALRQYFEYKVVHVWLELPPRAGSLRSELYSTDAVINESVDDQGNWIIEADIPINILKKFTEFQIPEESVQRASI